MPASQVKSWRSNDGFLGDGSFQAGIRATELRPGKDIGTSLLTGATEERFEILKWFYIEADDDTGYDATAEVIERAMTYLDDRTPHAEIEAKVDEERAESRDLLADLITRTARAGLSGGRAAVIAEEAPAATSG